jgi:lipopolysaccharide exporter
MQDKSQNDSTKSSPSLYKKAIRGGIWLFALRFFLLFISFGKMVVLMRVLMPADFGLLGFAMLTLAMMGSFSEMGFRQALIHKKENAKEYLDVAWTTNIVRGVLLFIIVFWIAPPVANFFDSSKPLELRDIVKPQALVDSLKKNENAFAGYLAEHLSSETKGFMNEYESGDVVSDEFVRSVVGDLNRIADGQLLYDPLLFKDVKLSGYAKGFVENPESIDDVFRTNKLLLQQAYPLEIRVTAIDVTQCIAVIRVIGLVVLLGGLTNIGVVYFAKELDFHKKFYFHASSSIIAAVVTITLAIIYRNVWALVFGKVIGSVINMILSYAMHPYRPRVSFDVKKIKNLWEYGRHMFAMQIMKFFCLHGDDAILAKMLGPTVLGFYQKAYEVGNLVAMEIGNKVAEVGFSAYSKLQDNIEKVRAGYLKSVQLTSLAVFPITGVLVVLAPEIVTNVIGDKWLEMVPAMRILCCFGPIRCMQRAPVFMGIGRPDILKKIAVVRFIIIAVSIYPLTKYYGMVGTSISVFLPVLVCQPMGFYYIDRLIGTKPKDVLRRLFLPIAGTLIMSVCMMLGKTCFDSVGLLQLVALLSMGGVVYLVILASGRFLGRDYDVVKFIKEIWASK